MLWEEYEGLWYVWLSPTTIALAIHNPRLATNQSGARRSLHASDLQQSNPPECCGFSCPPLLPIPNLIPSRCHRPPRSRSPIRPLFLLSSRLLPLPSPLRPPQTRPSMAQPTPVMPSNQLAAKVRLSASPFSPLLIYCPTRWFEMGD